MILSYFAKDHECGFFGQDLKILPILDDKKCFSFTYEVIGFNSSIDTLKPSQVYQVLQIFLSTIRTIFQELATLHYML